MYSEPEELQKKAEEYFNSLIEYNEEGEITKTLSPTITGLCLYLGFCDRRSFYDYGKREKFSHTIKKLHMMIEESYERSLKGNSVAGVIFALKNLGWSDKQEIEQVTTNVVHMPTITVDGKELEFNVGQKVNRQSESAEPVRPARQVDADNNGVQ